ncbi:MAG: hypothetical protein EXR50_01725 [Dehalococcoidia bacterium]|nr:hypothetical protein [Dehalococcoidia bacterium]
MQEPKVQEFNTRNGTVYIHSWAPRELLRELQIGDGLGAFWYYNAERVKTNLFQSLSNPRSEVILAYTPANMLVGYLLISSPSRRGRWRRLEVVYETTIEIAREWRRYGIAGKLLSTAVEESHSQGKIFLAEGYSWAWDLAGRELTPAEYREMWKGMMARYGFFECKTDDPGILGDIWSLMMAWVGPKVDEEKKSLFFKNLVMTV